MPKPPAHELIRHFQAFLEEAKLSPVSIKNYLSDVRLFLTSIEFRSIRDLGGKTAENYLTRIKQTKPEATFQRYNASLRRFITFLSVEYRLELPLPKANDLESDVKPAHNLLKQFRLYLTREKKSAATVKNYLSDLNHFLSWTAKNLEDSSDGGPQGLLRGGSQSALKLTSTTLKAYFDHLKLSHTSTSVTDRRASGLRKFVQFSLDYRLINHNPFETASPLPLIAKPIKKLYLHLAILILATNALGIFGYAQIFKEAKPGQAYPTALVRPSRQLAFQGRLTDKDGQPITTAAANVAFKLYNQAESGTEVYSVEACTVAPDEDGIFSTQIGNGTCGAEIGPEVFSENSSLFLEIAIGGQVLKPRQPIATSGYALNSETLQGYPASASATENTVPVVNNDGDLLIGAASPATISPNQSGSGPIFKALSGKTTVGQLSTAGDLGLLGGLTLGSPFTTHAWPGQIITNVNSRGLAGAIINQNDSGPIFTASSSGTTKFVFADNGNVGINTTSPNEGALVVVGRTWTDQFTMAKNPVSGYVLTSDNGGNATWEPGASDDWTLAGTTLYPNSTTYNTLLGATATASATGKLSVYGDNGTTPVATVAGATSFAALVVDNSGVGDIFTASASGLNRFSITNAGAIVIPSLNTAGAIVYTGTTGQLGVSGQGTGGECLTSGGSGTPVWVSCSVAANNY